MQSIAQQLESIINTHLEDLHALPADKLEHKTSPAKWSKKQIIGHMVDSAQNNIRRFVVAQYEDVPTIVYKQDNWVAIAGYQDYNSKDLINLWALLNKHIVRILRNVPAEMAQRNCQAESLHTIEWFAQDYLKHLLHHLHQVLEFEPITYP